MTATESTDYPPDMPDVDLASYVRAGSADATFIAETEVRAAQLVADKVAGHAVPDSVLSAAILEVGSNLYQRRTSSIGTTPFGEPELAGNPMRPALDPITPAYHLLRPYLGPGLA